MSNHARVKSAALSRLPQRRLGRNLRFVSRIVPLPEGAPTRWRKGTDARISDWNFSPGQSLKQYSLLDIDGVA